MKKIIGIIALVIIVLSACKNKDKFVVNGKFDNVKDLKKVVLYRRDKAVDSAILDANNEFKFTVIAPDPEFYFIAAGQKNYILLAKNGDELDFKADYSEDTGDYEISGSDDAEKLRDFNKLSIQYKKELTSIQKEYQQKLSENPALRDSLEQVLIPRFESTMTALSAKSIDFANDNKDNLAGFFAMASLDPAKYETELIKYSEDIKGKFPKNKDIEQFVAKMAKLKAFTVGQQAPDFKIPSVDNSALTLSQFKGKFLLLDFWASWCAPCREENPNLVKQYNTFKDKGFTILSVSLDDDRNQWLNAIKKDKLAWNHGSELKQWDSKIVQQYQLEALPSSFLLDKNGKIIAKNLRGKELEDFLIKTLN